MAVWQEKRLGDIFSLKYGKSSDKMILGSEYKVFSSSGLFGLSNSKLADKGIIVGRKGSVGSVFFSRNPFYCIDTTFYIDNTNNENMLFIYYYLKNMKLNLYNSDAAVPGLNKHHLERCYCIIPDLVTQEKIADILSTYDDLIENNNRRIEILEQMAQEIYKEWFVRFRFPGHEKVKFVNGLPEGWEVKTIGDIAHLKSGYAFKSSWWQEDGIPVIKIKDIQNNSIDINNFAYVSHMHMEKVKQFIAEPGDIVIALTGATIGKIGLIPFYHKPLLINQRVGKFFCEEKPILNNGYLYILLQQNWIKDLIFMISSSSAAQPNISPNDIEEIKIFYNKNVIEQFNQKISDYILQILKLKNINQNLIKQRDLLLPRLMSGKLEV